MSAETGVDIEDRSAVGAIASRLKAAVERAGGNKRVADRSGVALRTLNSYLAGAADPKVTKLDRIAEACGTSVNELMGRLSPGESAVNGTMMMQVQGGLPPDLVLVPRLEVRASAGPGRVAIPADNQGDFVGFRRGWLRSLGIAPENAELLVGEGDSMSPTICDGDLMLVDRGFGDVVNGKIYVLVVGGLVLVKRINLLALGGLMLISDNERYPTQTVGRSEMNDLKIEARVAWYGRAI